MESNEASALRTSDESPPPFPNSRCSMAHRFMQQNLPACKPVLTPPYVISIFLLAGTLFIPFGFAALLASNSVVEIVDRYDVECIPEAFRSNRIAYITDSSISKNCTRNLKVPKLMRAPIYVYYQLDNYYQNHRRCLFICGSEGQNPASFILFLLHVSCVTIFLWRLVEITDKVCKSRSDHQLLHGLAYNKTSSCVPEESSNGLPIVPCGLIAWSLFNDTYSFNRELVELIVNRKGLAWESDKDHKFGNDVLPFNFQNGTLIGGGKLKPDVPLNEQEDLIVWMRTAALPSFRKLYGKIEVDLKAGELITVNLQNNYNTYSFGGKKKLVISTASWLGGKNNFLGLAYLSVGSFCIFVSILFMGLHVKNPRPYVDTAYLSWSSTRTGSN